MGRNHHATLHAKRSHRHIGAVVKAAHELALLSDAGAESFGRCVSRLDERMIQHGVVFATHHEREASQIRQHGSGAILPIEPEQGSLMRKLVHSEVATAGPEGLTQFLPVEPIASGAPTEPSRLSAVGLTDHSAGPDNFPSLAPRVASSTDCLQSAKGRWQLFCLG